MPYVYPEVVVAAWERSLALAVAAHDVVVAGDRVLGRVSAEHLRAREAVVAVIDAAIAAGVSEQMVDAALARIGAEGRWLG